MDVNNRERNAQLSGVISRHYKRMGIWQLMAECGHCEQEIRDEEQYSANTATELCPRPYIAEKMDSGHGTPHHRVYEQEIQGAKRQEYTSQTWKHIAIGHGGDHGTDRSDARTKRLQAKCHRVEDMRQSEHDDSMKKISSFPDEQRVAEAGEQQTSENVPSVAAPFWERLPKEQDECHQRDNWKTFYDAVEERFRLGIVSKEHEIDGDIFDEVHQLRSDPDNKT